MACRFQAAVNLIATYTYVNIKDKESTVEPIRAKSFPAAFYTPKDCPRRISLLFLRIPV
jgi:hypothetical protein